MALSGDFTLNTTLNEMLNEAFDHLQIGQDGETLNGDRLLRALRTANMMIKEWENLGHHLWITEKGTLFPVVGTYEYDFSTAKLTNTFYETTLAAAAASGAGTITVASDTNFTNGMNIQVILSDDTGFWTTINGAPAANVITLAANLTGAAASGAKVRAYSDTLDRVSRIKSVRRRDNANQEVPIHFCSEEEYDLLSDKESSSDITQAFFKRGNPYGTLYVWGAPASAESLINFTYDRQFNIMTVGANVEFDMPDRWHSAFCWNLAARLIPKFGCTPTRMQIIQQFAEMTLTQALAFDTDVYPIQIKTSRR